MIDTEKLEKEVLALHKYFAKRRLNIAEAELVMRTIIGISHATRTEKMIKEGILRLWDCMIV